MKPISQLSPSEAAGIKYILMDIDDTLTLNGKLLDASYSALWKLNKAGFKLIPVTGRPAGWCDLIAREWPVHGVIGENGALAFWEEELPDDNNKKLPVLNTEFHPNAVKNDHQTLLRIKERVLKEFPLLRMAKDSFARLFDIAIDFAEEEPVLPLEIAEKVKKIAEQEGAIAKISSIHVNIWLGKYDKLSMAETFLKNRFGWEKGKADNEVVFVGDSPNDEPMFERFPLSCAVANISKYKDMIKSLPAYVASQEGGHGFAEIAGTILPDFSPHFHNSCT